MNNKCLFPSFGIVVLVMAGLVAGSAGPANADKAFREGFRTKYVKAESSDPKDAAFRAAVVEAGCNLCHVGDDRTNRNVYGQALGRFLQRETDAKNKQKIHEALEKTAALRSRPDDPKAPTFGELIGQGRLPAETTK